MKTFKFKKIDAFTNGSSPGNPAGAVYLDSSEEISIPEMQKIARELKGFVSEVGFILQSGEAQFDLKYYSSEREVEFCGHATVAILYDLLNSREELRSKDVVGICNNKGRLAVYNRIDSEDAVFISAPQPVFSNRTISIEELSQALRTDPGVIDHQQPTAIINAGLETLIVPIGGLDGILALEPDIDELNIFCIKNCIDILTVFTRETADPCNAYRTRVFAPTFGYLEDPATGSGNSAFGYYLLKNGYKPEATITLEQNGTRSNANRIKLEFIQKKDGTPQVLFGGNAVVRISGEYRLF